MPAKKPYLLHICTPPKSDRIKKRKIDALDIVLPAVSFLKVNYPSGQALQLWNMPIELHDYQQYWTEQPIKGGGFYDGDRRAEIHCVPAKKCCIEVLKSMAYISVLQQTFWAL